MNKRIFIKKKADFDNKSKEIYEKYNIKANVYLIYDIFDLKNQEELDFLITNILCEDYTDEVSFEIDLPKEEKDFVAIGLSTGQFDIRAEAVKQIFNIKFNTEITVVCGTFFMGSNIRNIVISNYFNPVDMSVLDLSTLVMAEYSKNDDIIICDEFLDLTSFDNFKDKYSITLGELDLIHVQKYFKNINRNPFLIELKVLDTYWSDHTRHTTFNTILENVEIEDEVVKNTYEEFLADNVKYNKDKPVTLMNLATINQRILKQQGKLENVEVSEEINACSVEIKEINGLLMFKNETHNHPTEIEPIGGAETCIGGAIRDPLSGRSYVYQALRLSGSSDPFGNLQLDDKLPQKRISLESAKGNSSYGNSIGVTTSLVKEIFDDSYIAKHLEVGAVVAYAKKDCVKRLTPEDTDVVIILGGKTGRDGIGGATGSSVSHTKTSVKTAGAEVQKGNPIEERKLQRLFRNPEFAKRIKRCNDFGAGGVCVAVGEIADSLDIYLHKVPLKYMGLSPVEVAISESQERMAIVVEKKDVDKIHTLAMEENIESTEIGVITNSGYLRMYYNDKLVFDVERKFIDTNGITRHMNAFVPELSYDFPKTMDLENMVVDKHFASQKYLSEIFDSTIGARTVLNPYGGIYEETEEYVSSMKIPDETDLCSNITYGFNTKLSSNPFLSSYYAVVESVAKLVSKGVELSNIYLSFQEYFESLREDSAKWGKPLTALLGAYKAQKELGIVAIGGKDSMSGTYLDTNVTPTLISFAVGYNKKDHVISTDMKDINSNIYLLEVEKTDKFLNLKNALTQYSLLTSLISENKILSTSYVGLGGISLSLFNMGIGSRIGINCNFNENDFSIGDILIESKEKLPFNLIGTTNSSGKLTLNNKIYDYIGLTEKYKDKFKGLYGYSNPKINIKEINYVQKEFVSPHKEKMVNVVIPVFPGTNCEDDIRRAFEICGNVNVQEVVIKNYSQEALNDSIDLFEKAIKNSHIIALAGGFSLCDEPDGSGKFISNILSIPKIKKAINEHLGKKHLILGICNGFQALVRSGLLDFTGNLYYNDCNKHIAKIVNAKITSNNSPWLKGIEVGEIYKTPISHGEGKLIITEEEFNNLNANSQIFSLYADENNQITSTSSPNGSLYAIEGIISKNGLVLGKMGHNERVLEGQLKNIYGNKYMGLFKNAVNYIKGE